SREELRGRRRAARHRCRARDLRRAARARRDDRPRVRCDARGALLDPRRGARRGRPRDEGACMMEPRVAIISDTVDNIDGIALGLKRLVAASRRAGHAITLVGPASTCTDDGAVRIASAMQAALPIYPDYTWSVPELPPLVAHLARTADLVQVATPGPMGLAG